MREVLGWLQAQAWELANRFDQRNGNDYFREHIQARLALQQHAQPEED